MGKSKGLQASYILWKLLFQNLVLKKNIESKNCWKYPTAMHCFILSCFYGLPGIVTTVRQSLHTAGIRRCGDNRAGAGGRSIFTPCCSTQKEMLFPGPHQNPSMPSLSEADVIWMWCVLSPYPLPQQLRFPCYHPSPYFVHKQNVKWCICDAGAELGRRLSRF